MSYVVSSKPTSNDNAILQTYRMSYLSKSKHKNTHVVYVLLYLNSSYDDLKDGIIIRSKFFPIFQRVVKWRRVMFFKLQLF